MEKKCQIVQCQNQMSNCTKGVTFSEDIIQNFAKIADLL